MLITRKMSAVLKEKSAQYPIVTITGPRQSGKTTLSKMTFPGYEYISLEKPDVRRRAQNDPNSFFENFKNKVIVDEIQRVPELLSYIQVIVDEKKVPGQFILTGSAQFELMENINQSLAGRTALLKLLPFSFGEIYKDNKASIDINNLLYSGFYPRIFDQKLNPTEVLGYYYSTYVERDIRKFINIKDISRFETFIKLSSGRVGQLLNFNSLASEAGINHNTASSWISILNASYIIYKLRPYFKNFNKRLVKSSKLYFYDTGLICYLLDIQEADHLQNHPLKGSIFENFIITELLKQQYNNNTKANFYFWRDNVGHEIDLLIDYGNVLLTIEIKSGKTVVSDFFKNINFFKKNNQNVKKSAIIYGGDETFVENDTWIISYKDICLFEKLDYKLDIL